MFDHVHDSGVGFQLSMYRLLDSLDDARQMGRENVLLAQTERLRAEYNRLLDYAQGLERELQQRDQQLATTQQELAQVKAELNFQLTEWQSGMIARQERARARAAERDAGSQSP